MSAAPGQARPKGGRRAGWGGGWRWAHRCTAVAFALLALLLLGLGLLAWRLSERPLDLPQLARRIEAAVNDRPDGPRLSIGRAAIAWEGFHGGAAAPLDIRLSEVRLRAPSGDSEIDLPEAALTLSVRALLRGVIAPATIDLLRPRLRATLTEGGIALGFERRGPDPGADAGPEARPESDTEAGAAAETTDLAALLAGLMRPASDQGTLTALRRLRILGGEAVLADPAAGLAWTLLEPRLDLRRAAGGGLAIDGEAVLRAGAVSVPLRIAGEAQGTPMRVSLGLMLPALRPPQLATIWPPLAPLAVLDAPVALTARAEFDATARPGRLEARLVAGAGDLAFTPDQRLPLAGLDAVVEGSSRALRVREAVLRLPGQGPLPGPAMTATGEVTEHDGAFEAAFDLVAGPLQAAEVPRLWPEALAPVARAAALRTMPSGLVREARARIGFAVPPTLDRATLHSARLGLAAAQAMFGFGAARVVAETVELDASYAPGRARLERLTVRLPGTDPSGGPAASPIVTAEGEALLGDGRWRIAAGARLDAVQAAALPAYWPAGLGAGARDWITGNITAGRIRNGQWRLEAEASEALDAVRPTSLTGSLEVSGATIHWLRPVPPVVGAAGTVEFGLSEVTIRGRAGRQALPDGRPGGIELKEGVIRFSGLEAEPGQADLALQVAGPLPEIFTLLRHPRLKLFEKRKLEVQATAGQVEARLGIGFPLLAELPMEALRIRATGKVAEARLPGALIERDVERANLDLAVDTDGLRLSGGALLVGASVRLGLEMDFRGGPATQVTERGTLTGRLEARQVKALGIETGEVLEGPVALDARYERRRGGQGSVALRGDLREARLGVEALNWAKPAGTPGLFEGTLRLQGETLATMEAMRLDTEDLRLRGRAGFGPRARLEQVAITEGALGGSRFTGEVRRPEREGGPWQASLRGPVLDLRPILGPADPARQGALPAAPDAAPDEAGLPLLLNLRFDQVSMGPGRLLHALQARVRSDARGLLREAQALGRTGTAPGQGEFDLALAPQGQQRLLRLTAADGGALLQALDLTDSIRGGRLTVTAAYPELRPGAALTGTAELDGFVLSDAPGFAKLLQAMTLYGLVEAVQGGNGLVFSRLVAPFTLTPEALTLRDARAFSASLGLTAKGRIDRARRVVAVEGTIVPAYVFNTLLGNLPLLGRLFSPETGGGVFAATFRVQGLLADPQVTVNPLAALTPGFLRGLFGLGRPREAGPSANGPDR